MFIPKGNLFVRDVMLSIDRFPVIGESIILKEALEEMSRKRFGIACIVDEQKKLLGILTDGDVRRMILRVQKPFSAIFIDDALSHSIKRPLTIAPGDTLLHSAQLMGEKQIWDLPVINSDGMLVGLLHLHPAVEALLGIHG